MIMSKFSQTFPRFSRININFWHTILDWVTPPSPNSQSKWERTWDPSCIQTLVLFLNENRESPLCRRIQLSIKHCTRFQSWEDSEADKWHENLLNTCSSDGWQALFQAGQCCSNLIIAYLWHLPGISPYTERLQPTAIQKKQTFAAVCSSQAALPRTLAA